MVCARCSHIACPSHRTQPPPQHPSPHLHHRYHHLQIPQLEVWFQRASDVVRKLRYGDIDLGIVGYDMFLELADNDPDLMVVSSRGGSSSWGSVLGSVVLRQLWAFRLQAQQR